mmetsp:Transcript_20923/g.37273  ORF Transcript_20923/g.37273 Transcript_20923/m.37273 type:complete len:164 (-) Transcript_20923:52-543(-)
MNTYTGGKALVGNWFEERFEQKAKSNLGGPVPTEDRVVPKRFESSYETETSTSIKEKTPITEGPKKDMLQFSNFEHLNAERQLPQAPLYGFGSHLPRKKPQKESTFVTTAHTAYGGKHKQRDLTDPLPEMTLHNPSKPEVSRTIGTTSQYTASHCQLPAILGQ